MVEHIVHIDGVTGSSPVATTNNPRFFESRIIPNHHVKIWFWLGNRIAT